MKEGYLKDIFNQVTEEFPSDLSAKSQKQAKKKASLKKKDKSRGIYKNQARMKNSAKKPSKSKKPSQNMTTDQAKREYLGEIQIQRKEDEDPRKIKPTAKEMRKAVIYSEILGKPKSLR